MYGLHAPEGLVTSRPFRQSGREIRIKLKSPPDYPAAAFWLPPPLESRHLDSSVAGSVAVSERCLTVTQWIHERPARCCIRPGQE